MVLFLSLTVGGFFTTNPIYISLWFYSYQSAYFVQIFILHIYIPLWFYSYLEGYVLIGSLNNLHSTMVLFLLVFCMFFVPVHVDLHSTMVLFLLTMQPFPQHHINIYIPLWFYSYFAMI